MRDVDPACPTDSTGPTDSTARSVAAPAPRASRLRGAVAARVGGLPGTFWWLWLGTVVNRAGGFVQPFLVLYLTTARGLSVPEAGAVLTAWGVGAVASQPVGGACADRLGRRVTLAGALAATGAGLAALGLVRGLPALLVVAAVVGLAGDAYRPAATAVVADVLDDAQRTRAYALLYWAINVGFSVAALTGGLLAGHGYWLLFALDAATCVAFAAVVLVKVPETGARRTGPGDGRPGAGLRTLLGDRLLLWCVLLTFGYALLYLQQYVLLPLHTRDAGLGAGGYGAAIAVNGIAVIVLQPVLLTLNDRVPRGPLLGVGTLLVGGGLALAGTLGSVPLVMAAMVVFTVGEILVTGAAQSLVIGLAPPELRGRYAGATGLAFGAASLAGPLLGTSAYAADPRATWLGVVVLGALGGAGFWLLGRAADRRRG